MKLFASLFRTSFASSGKNSSVYKELPKIDCRPSAYRKLPEIGCSPSAAFKLGSFVRVRDTPPVQAEESNQSSEDTSSEDDDEEDVYGALMRLRSKIKWLRSMDGTCSKVGIVVDGRKKLGCTRLLFENNHFTYLDEWLQPLDEKDLDKSLCDRLKSRYETVADSNSVHVFAGKSAFHFVQPQYVRVLGPDDFVAARDNKPKWTVFMNETVGKVGMVAGGFLSRRITTVLFDDGTWYNYKDEWLCSATQIAGQSQFLQSDTSCSEQVDSSVWKSMRDRYLNRRDKYECI